MGSRSPLRNTSACFQEGARISILNLSPSPDNEANLKKRSTSRLRQCHDPIERIRCLCLSNGFSSLKDFIRYLKAREGNGESLADLINNAINAGVVKGVEEDARKLSCTATEFIEKLKPPLNQTRRSLLNKIFELLDESGKGYCTINELRSHYNYRKDPLFTSGTKTKEEVFSNFLKSFNFDAHENGKVTKEEFIDFYSAYSAAIENDINFDFIMRNTWDI